MTEMDCGGCLKQGRHRRWCAAWVGISASRMGRNAEAAEALGDTTGSNHPGAANHLYVASGMLREEAQKRAAEWRRINGIEESA